MLLGTPQFRYVRTDRYGLGVASPERQPGEPGVDSVEKAFARGDEDALREAYLRYGGLVHTFCRRTLDESRANDVTQDVFVSAWRSRERYEPAKGTLAGWLIAITKSRIVDHVRAEQRHALRRSDNDPSNVPVTAEVERIGDRLMIAEALRCLSDRARRVIALHYFDDLTHQQIADRMSMPLGTVKSDLRRGLLQIRHQLESAHG